MNAWNRYWHEFEIERNRVLAFRVFFFGLLAFDLWNTMIPHAPRYGAGQFNVAQFGVIDTLLPVPSTPVVTAIWLIGGFLALRLALGLHKRVSAIGVCLAYSGVYFWSQADSYQHHYMIALLLIIFCFTPSDQLRGGEGTVKHWTWRLVYVQVGLVYFWAAVTKTDPMWLDGITMRQLAGGPEVRSMMLSVAERFGIDNVYAFGAAGVMLGEFFAAAAYFWRRLWFLGWLVVVWFHVGVEILEYKIEWFSYFMFGVNLVLLAPKRLIERPGALTLACLCIATMPLTGSHLESIYLPLHVFAVYLIAALPASATAPLDALALRFRRFTVEVPGGAPALRWGLAAGVAVVALGAGFSIPLEGVAGFAVLAAVLAAWAQLQAPRPGVAAATQVFALAAVVGWMHLTPVPYDYYRLWGGDLKRRQAFEASADRYAKANAIKTTGPAREHQLGQMLNKLNRVDDALAAYERSVARYQAAVVDAQREVFRAAGDPDPLAELGDLQSGLATRCRSLASLKQQLAQDGVAEANECRKNATREALDAYAKALAIKPNHRQALKGQRSLKRRR